MAPLSAKFQEDRRESRHHEDETARRQAKFYGIVGYIMIMTHLKKDFHIRKVLPTELSISKCERLSKILGFMFCFD